MAVALVAGCGSATGSATGAGAAPPASATVGAAAPPSGAGRASGTGTPSAPVPSGAPAPLARSVPVRLEIPGIGVDTPVIRLGLAADGTVQVPPIAAHAPAGWYQGSPTPGQTGPSVILAHVTVGQYGDGVFLHLSRMKPGDRVVARLSDGASAVFTVYRVRTVAKSAFPTAEVYGNTARPELRLITCGGPRGSDGTGYLDNVVVFAALTSTSGGTAA
ncbi:class F sortase [Streptacidiphilus cavernicola]|uniref:Class F sortase n=1 Tax=Streptacidiphilus cavernicola TaxID=3342716 RepID=A0ABV6W3F3_9ACTN